MREQRSHAAAIERLPTVLRLCEAVGNGVQCSGMMAHAGVTRSDLDAFSMGASILDAALPCHDTVGSAEDGCRGYGRRVVKVGRHLSILDRAIRKRIVEVSRVCRPGVALERASQRDHQPYVVDSQFREFACINAAQAPADQAHFAAALTAQLPETREQAFF